MRCAVAGLHSVSVLAAKRAVLRPGVGLGRRLPPSGHRTVRRQARRRLQCSQEKPGPWGTAHCLLGHSLGRDGLEARGMRRWGLIDAGHRPQQGHHDESIRVDKRATQGRATPLIACCTARVISGLWHGPAAHQARPRRAGRSRGHIQAEWQCARALARQEGIVAAYGQNEAGSETVRGRALVYARGHGQITTAEASALLGEKDYTACRLLRLHGWFGASREGDWGQAARLPCGEIGYRARR